MKQFVASTSTHAVVFLSNQTRSLGAIERLHWETPGRPVPKHSSAKNGNDQYRSQVMVSQLGYWTERRRRNTPF